MAYYITYIKNNETHELEWIAGNGWTIPAIRQCFQRRFHGAEIISIYERPCCTI